MSEEIAAVVPPPLRYEFGIPPQAGSVAAAVLLITGDEDGFPRVAVMSPAELSAGSPDSVIMQLRRGTATWRNLQRRAAAALWCVLDAAAYTIRGIASTAIEQPQDEAYGAAMLNIRSVLRDFEPGAPMVKGPSYRVPAPSADN